MGKLDEYAIMIVWGCVYCSSFTFSLKVLLTVIHYFSQIQETIKVDIDTKNQDGSLKSEDKAGGGDEGVDSEASGGGSSSDSSNGGGGGGGTSAGQSEKGSDDINSDSKGMTS